jgi:hypothetical protein
MEWILTFIGRGRPVTRDDPRHLWKGMKQQLTGNII